MLGGNGVHRVEDLLGAYRLLFEPDGPLAANDLAKLTPGSLKTAFRRQALRTHPDRARVLAKDEALLARRYTAVRAAYEALGTFLANGQRTAFASPISAPSSSPTRPRRRDTANGFGQRHRWTPPGATRVDHYHRGSLPRRGLLIGEYLYYSGIVSWRALIDAVSWQQRQRPLIGQLAVRLGVLTAAEVADILDRRHSVGRTTECFVRFAGREGYLTAEQMLVLLDSQSRLQRPIGEYFTGRGLLAGHAVERLVGQAWAHTLRFDFG